MLIIHDGNSNKAFFTLCDFSVFYTVGGWVGVCVCVCVIKAVKKLLVWLIVYMSRNQNQANCLTKLTNWDLRILVDLSFDYFFMLISVLKLFLNYIFKSSITLSCNITFIFFLNKLYHFKRLGKFYSFLFDQIIMVHKP